MEEIDEWNESDYDPHSEIQRMRTTRGGISYDWRPQQNGAKNPHNSTISRGVDEDHRRRLAHDPNPKPQVGRNDSAKNQANATRTLTFYRASERTVRHGLDIPLTDESGFVVPSRARNRRDTHAAEFDQTPSEDISMPSLERRPSQSENTEPRIDDLHISANPRSLIDEERHANADRPRTPKSIFFGAASSRPGQDKYYHELSREDCHFSDTYFR